MEDIGEFLIPYLPNVRIATALDKVYKDECCLSYDSPFSESGLFVCLQTFLSFGRKYVEKYHQWSGNSIFLKLKKVPQLVESVEEPKKVIKLAIGVEGGFQTDGGQEQKFSDENSIVILPDFIEISVDRIEEIPSHLLLSIDAILSTESASKKDFSAWEGEQLIVSRHSENLTQLDNGVKIGPSDWKCARCDLTENLWANLSDGTILCGRRHYDGSGGNEHALEHFRETGYPLVVKLGTINPSGADVFSYDEDDMVQDTNLAKHLTHFGINMMNMEKSDKTMSELEIDVNQRLGNEWDILQESGKKLSPVYGPCLTGMTNTGNSCYLNSVCQVLCSIDEVSKAYISKHEEIFRSSVYDPASDFNLQITKLFLGLASGDYSSAPEKLNVKGQSGIVPTTFRLLAGRGHPEFSSSRQQDAQEYLLHVLSLMEKNSRRIGINPTSVFRYAIEERLECLGSKTVRYANKPEYIMALPIPCEAATNKEEVHKCEMEKQSCAGDKTAESNIVVPRLKIPFSACLEAFFQDEVIDGFWSPALREKATAKKSVRFSTFPNYLVVQLKKFAVGDDWVPRKLDVSVDVPDELDLEDYRGNGLQNGETSMPDVDPPPASDVPKESLQNIDQAVVNELISFGFPQEACVKAVHFTHNSGLEAATNWLIDHQADPDFAVPMANPAEPSSASDAPEESVAMIISMGFTRKQALMALKATNNNVERAGDWIFTHLDELDSGNTAEGDGAAAQSSMTCDNTSSENSALVDGPGRYRLVAFISHMGTSTLCGHYVCHIKLGDKWVIFNDEKVAESDEPPKSLGYLYFYRRHDA